MLTETEAWAYLAEAWSKTTIQGGHPKALVLNEWLTGLCNCVNVLYYTETIDELTRDIMGAKLDVYRVSHDLVDWDYYWPLTLEGAEARAEFCKTQGAHAN